jgi:hypothetical protein
MKTAVLVGVVGMGLAANVAMAGAEFKDLRALPGGQISPIGAPPGVYEYATAVTISENGLQVGGTSNAISVRFSLDGNRPVGLPAPAGGWGGAATGITDSGEIVGYGLTSGPFRALKWSSSNVPTNLGGIPGSTRDSYLIGISRDGSISAGYGLNAAGSYRAARHTSAGWQLIGTRSGGTGYQIATNISRDGSTVVGYDDRGAFKWTANSGFATFSNLANQAAGSTFISDSTPDGGILVGSTGLNDGFAYATIWNGSTPTNVGRFGNFTQTILTAVSSDGKSAIGYAYTPLNNVPANDARSFRAVYWSELTGLVDLNAYVQSLGVTLPAGSTLTYGADISGDGRTIIGNYQNSIREIRPFYISNIPGPGALLMFGVAALAGRRRR